MSNGCGIECSSNEMPAEADKLVMEIQAARRSLQHAAPDERAFYEQWIEASERRLIEMRTANTPALVIAPAQTIVDEPTGEEDAVEDRCGCGRPRIHRGRCAARTAAAEARKMGGGRETVKQKPAIAAEPAPAAAPLAPVENGNGKLERALANDPTSKLQFSILAIQNGNRVEVSGDSPTLLLKTIEIIRGME